VSITSTVPVGSCTLCDPSGTLALDGTSMATPHVAGVAALWLESLRTDNPQVSIRTLDARLTGTASLSPISDPSDRHDSGSGLVRAPN
jgi:subtilisin family serine protease